MCEEEYILENEMLQIMRDHVFKGKEEYCAYLKILPKYDTYDIKFDAYTLTMGKTIKGRKTCDNVGTNTTYLYHSHPIMSRSYPSTEDVMKLVKHPRSYKVSIIATRWGIYTLKNTFKSIADNKNIDEYLLSRYEEEISNILQEIGRMENNKGFVSHRKLTPETMKGEHRVKHYKTFLLPNELKLIRDQLHKIYRLTSIKLSFCPWNELF